MHSFNTIILALGIITCSVWFWPFPGTQCRELYIISTDSMTTNEEYISANLRTEFIRRGCQGISGYLYFNQLIIDDNLMIEGRLSYNSEDSNKFARTPFGFRPQKTLNFINNFYRSYIMNPLANCSDFPQMPTRRENLDGLGKNYTLNKCILDINLFPALSLGYYSATVIAIRNVSPTLEFNITFIFKIE